MLEVQRETRGYRFRAPREPDEAWPACAEEVYKHLDTTPRKKEALLAASGIEPRLWLTAIQFLTHKGLAVREGRLGGTTYRRAVEGGPRS